MKKTAETPGTPRAVRFDKSIVPGVEMKRCTHSPYDYKAHVHRELTLAYIQEGSTDLSLSDITIHFKTGNGVIIPPLVTHRCAPNDINRWAYVVLFIDPAYYAGMAAFSRVRRLEGAQALRLKETIGQLSEAADADTMANDLIDLLIALGDDIQPEPGSEPGVTERVREYLLEHVYAPVTLDRLEHAFGINRFSLIKDFRRLYATTPAAFHLQCRVAEAKDMAARGKDVFEICDALHFYDQAHLIREFRKMYGITPSAYMKQLNR